MKIVLDKEKCSECNICRIACMDQNDGLGNVPASCVHCGICIDVCPMECISRDEKTGFVVYDSTDCIGCGACRDACPLSVPQIECGKMHKCDGCNERVKAGLEPACVRSCPVGALAVQ